MALFFYDEIEPWNIFKKIKKFLGMTKHFYSEDCLTYGIVKDICRLQGEDVPSDIVNSGTDDMGEINDRTWLSYRGLTDSEVTAFKDWIRGFPVRPSIVKPMVGSGCFSYGDVHDV